ncbi:integrase [Pandoraea horticolens]|uniref:Integrase n=1 Tax=Pandoraea horticolens TaxID=2508298 RepID=A0A5E4TXL9_9BURK|nr:site-specific integrase [Pandoraea horticolens]VVD91324.1 integrase [Pandoraea horticolens]
MASIVEIKRGFGVRWKGVVRRAGVPTQVAYFDVRDDAEEWVRVVDNDARERQNEIKRQQALDALRERSRNEHRTFGDVLHRYLIEIVPHKRGADVEATRIKAFLKTPISKILVESLTQAHFAAWRDARLRSVGGSTVNRDLTILSHVIRVARAEWDVQLSRNPLHNFRKPKSNPPRERRLSPDEEVALLNACAETRNRHVVPVIVLALETAMRMGEIVHLDWSRIDLERQSAYLSETKTGVPRGVPLSTRAVEILVRLGVRNRGRVFRGLTENALRHAYARAVERAGIKNLTFHDLRHEATSRIVEKGLTMLEVATITGHKDLRMLQRYTHLRTQDLAKKLG